MYLRIGMLSRLGIAFILLSPWLVAAQDSAGSITYEIEEDCPLNDAGRLDIDFTDEVRWGGCDGEQSCQPDAPLSNIVVSADPKLGWTNDGLGSIKGFVQRNKGLSLDSYWSPETVSGICLDNLEAGESFTISGVYVVFDDPTQQTKETHFSFTDTLMATPADGDIYFRFKSKTSENDIVLLKNTTVLLKNATISTEDRETEFTVAGINLSETVTVDCRNSGCDNTEEKVVNSGEFDATISNLIQFDDETSLAADFKLERVLTIVDPRDCSNPESLRSKLKVNLNDGSAHQVYLDSLPSGVVGSGESPAVLIPETSCGIEVRNANGTSEKIIRLGIVDSDFLNTERSRITLTKERVETEINLILEPAAIDATGQTTPTECKFTKDSPTLLWLPIPAYNLSPNIEDNSENSENEVPVVVYDDDEKASVPLNTMVEVESGCGSVRGGFLMSVVAWNTEPSAYLTQDTETTDSLDERKDLVLREIAFTDELNQQTAACLTNGEVTSTFSSLLKKLAREIADNDWDRSIDTANALEQALDAPDTIADMSNLYWDWYPPAGEDIYAYNPVCYETGPTGLQYEPVGYNQRLWGMVKHLQFQICGRLAEDPDLCASLPE